MSCIYNIIEKKKIKKKIKKKKGFIMPHGTSSQGLGDTAGAEVKTGVQKRALKPTQILKEFKTTGQLL